MFLRVRAPFAAFRWLQAGVYRATSPTIPPSAAWGLVLNVAGVDTRDATSRTVTIRRKDVPSFEVSVGEVTEPQKSTLYQQLHGYPVGNSGKDLASRSHGSKYWIAPVRRDLLADLDLVIGIRGALPELRTQIERGLSGLTSRYGLPFLGDNNLLIDRIDLLDESVAARWYSRVDSSAGRTPDSCRLTVEIDREDSSRTQSAIYARTCVASDTPPAAAWTLVPDEPTNS